MSMKSESKASKKAERKARIASLTPAQKRKRKLKIAVLIIFIVLVTTAILYFAGKMLSEKLDTTPRTVQADETYQTFNFYPAPEKSTWKNIDVFSDGDYLKLDYNPSVTSELTAGTMLIKDIPKENKNEAHIFFEKYFEMLQKGNYEIYPTLFSEKYKKNMTGFEDNINRQFPPQMVYDIKITELARVPGMVVDNKSCVIGLYEVSYLIFKNNGLFRKDIGKDLDLGRDIARPLLFELITFDAGTDKEKTYINNLYTASSIMSESDANG